MLAMFATFLALDTGILTKLSFQGADLQRTGLVLSIVPIVLSYLYYRTASQISFVHDLRTAIAVLYKKLHEPVYYGGLDLFVHVPTVRNLESYDSLRAPDIMKRFHDRTTDAVVFALSFAPLLALGYCLVRLWHYPDLSLMTWIITVLVSIVFIVRALLYGLKSEDDDRFSNREKPAV